MTTVLPMLLQVGLTASTTGSQLLSMPTLPSGAVSTVIDCHRLHLCHRCRAQNVPPSGFAEEPLCAVPCVIGYDCIYQSIYLAPCNNQGAIRPDAPHSGY